MRAQPAPGEEQGRDEARPQRIGTHLRSSLAVSLRLLRRLARRSTGPGRRTRPGLGPALGQLARIGAVARPAPARLATTLHLVLAGLGHALRDLLLAGLVLLALSYGTLLYPEGRARRSGFYPATLAALLLRRLRGRDDRATPAGPDAADPGRPGCHGGGRRRLVERLGLGRDVVLRHRLDVLLGHALGDDPALGPDLDLVEVERHGLGADAEEAAARDHEALDLAGSGVDDGVPDPAERLTVRALDRAADHVGGPDGLAGGRRGRRRRCRGRGLGGGRGGCRAGAGVLGGRDAREQRHRRDRPEQLLAHPPVLAVSAAGDLARFWSPARGFSAPPSGLVAPSASAAAVAASVAGASARPSPSARSSSSACPQCRSAPPSGRNSRPQVAWARTRTLSSHPASIRCLPGHRTFRRGMSLNDATRGFVRGRWIRPRPSGSAPSPCSAAEARSSRRSCRW